MKVWIFTAREFDSLLGRTMIPRVIFFSKINHEHIYIYIYFFFPKCKPKWLLGSHFSEFLAYNEYWNRKTGSLFLCWQCRWRKKTLMWVQTCMKFRCQCHLVKEILATHVQSNEKSGCFFSSIWTCSFFSDRNKEKVDHLLFSKLFCLLWYFCSHGRFTFYTH